MYMVGHKNVGMQRAAITKKALAQSLKVTLPILVIEKARESIVTTLHDMLGNAGDIWTG